jgi:hypothetical protein
MICNSVLLTSTVAILALAPICRAQTQEVIADSAIAVARADMRRVLASSTHSSPGCRHPAERQ